ncbi:hypothetical protein DL93DRAFT_2159825 [Clavulina sp. PMI_390]|nr:hypothetical protein DL93DRAFT_2159825 [Clavulina sp. PMI_390]
MAQPPPKSRNVAPLLNPFEQMPTSDFDAFVTDISSAIRFALNPRTSSTPSQARTASPASTSSFTASAPNSGYARSRLGDPTSLSGGGMRRGVDPATLYQKPSSTNPPHASSAIPLNAQSATNQNRGSGPSSQVVDLTLSDSESDNDADEPDDNYNGDDGYAMSVDAPEDAPLNFDNDEDEQVDDDEEEEEEEDDSLLDDTFEMQAPRYHASAKGKGRAPDEGPGVSALRGITARMSSEALLAPKKPAPPLSDSEEDDEEEEEEEEDQRGEEEEFGDGELITYEGRMYIRRPKRRSVSWDDGEGDEGDGYEYEEVHVRGNADDGDDDEEEEEADGDADPDVIDAEGEEEEGYAESENIFPPDATAQDAYINDEDDFVQSSSDEADNEEPAIQYPTVPSASTAAPADPEVISIGSSSPSPSPEQSDAERDGDEEEEGDDGYATEEEAAQPSDSLYQFSRSFDDSELRSQPQHHPQSQIQYPDLPLHLHNIADAPMQMPMPMPMSFDEIASYIPFDHEHGDEAIDAEPIGDVTFQQQFAEGVELDPLAAPFEQEEEADEVDEGEGDMLPEELLVPPAGWAPVGEEEHSGGELLFPQPHGLHNDLVGPAAFPVTSPTVFLHGILDPSLLTPMDSEPEQIASEEEDRAASPLGVVEQPSVFGSVLSPMPINEEDELDIENQEGDETPTDHVVDITSSPPTESTALPLPDPTLPPQPTEFKTPAIPPHMRHLYPPEPSTSLDVQPAVSPKLVKSSSSLFADEEPIDFNPPELPDPTLPPPPTHLPPPSIPSSLKVLSDEEQRDPSVVAEPPATPLDLEPPVPSWKLSGDDGMGSDDAVLPDPRAPPPPTHLPMPDVALPVEPSSSSVVVQPPSPHEVEPEPRSATNSSDLATEEHALETSERLMSMSPERQVAPDIEFNSDVEDDEAEFPTASSTTAMPPNSPPPEHSTPDRAARMTSPALTAARRMPLSARIETLRKVSGSVSGSSPPSSPVTSPVKALASMVEEEGEEEDKVTDGRMSVDPSQSLEAEPVPVDASGDVEEPESATPKASAQALPDVQLTDAEMEVEPQQTETTVRTGSASASEIDALLSPDDGIPQPDPGHAEIPWLSVTDAPPEIDTSDAALKQALASETPTPSEIGLDHGTFKVPSSPLSASVSPSQSVVSEANSSSGTLRRSTRKRKRVESSLPSLSAAGSQLLRKSRSKRKLTHTNSSSNGHSPSQDDDMSDSRSSAGSSISRSSRLTASAAASSLSHRRSRSKLIQPIVLVPAIHHFHTHGHNHNHNHTHNHGSSAQTGTNGHASASLTPTSASAARPGHSRSSSVTSASQPSLNSSQHVTRSQCRFHRVSAPGLVPGTSVYFIVPGCSLSATEVMEREHMVDCGIASDEDNLNKILITDVNASGLDAQLASALRKLVGIDLIHEGVCGYLPAPESKDDGEAEGEESAEAVEAEALEKDLIPDSEHLDTPLADETTPQLDELDDSPEAPLSREKAQTSLSSIHRPDDATSSGPSSPTKSASSSPHQRKRHPRKSAPNNDLADYVPSGEENSSDDDASKPKRRKARKSEPVDLAASSMDPAGLLGGASRTTSHTQATSEAPLDGSEVGAIATDDQDAKPKSPVTTRRQPRGRKRQRHSDALAYRPSKSDVDDSDDSHSDGGAALKSRKIKKPRSSAATAAGGRKAKTRGTVEGAVSPTSPSSAAAIGTDANGDSERDEPTATRPSDEETMEIDDTVLEAGDILTPVSKASFEAASEVDAESQEVVGAEMDVDVDEPPRKKSRWWRPQTLFPMFGGRRS